MNAPDTRVWRCTTPADRSRAHLLRHRLFCLGGCGEALEQCEAKRPDGPHDEWDGPNTHLLVGRLHGELVAGARVVPGPGLPSLKIVEKRGGRVPANPSRCAEPSRVGLMAEHQGTPAGRELLLGLLGLITTTAVENGFPYGFLTIRPGLLAILMKLMPIDFDEPFLYQGEDHGPHTARPIPTWAVHTNFHEIGAAIQGLQPDVIASRMFPNGFDWIDWSLVRPMAELEAAMAANPIKFGRHMTAWRKAHLTG